MTKMAMDRQAPNDDEKELPFGSLKETSVENKSFCFSKFLSFFFVLIIIEF